MSNVKEFIARWNRERDYTRRWTFHGSSEFAGSTPEERAREACDRIVTPILMSVNEMSAIDELISYYRLNQEGH